MRLPALRGRYATGAVQTVVVKIGSAVLAPGASPDGAVFDRLAREAARAARSGWRTALVSSGAIACGLGPMGFAAPPRRVLDRQAAAAVGQQRLMALWGEAFDAAGAGPVAQVLLTADDLEHRARFLNARHTLDRLLRAGVTPIVNENDSVVYDEITVGDNDRLAALVAVALGAEALIMLSSVDGVLDREGRVAPEIVDPRQAEPWLRPGRSATGVGGMRAKLDAAQTARRHGVRVWIAPGRREGVIAAVLNREAVGTRIDPIVAGPAARKAWIGATVRPRGRLRIDGGAADALLRRGASLLPRGVVAVDGEFEQGAVVEILGPGGEAVGRGLASYSSAEIRRIAGRRTDEIEAILGYAYTDEVVHRDDLAIARGADERGAPQ